MIGEQRKGKRSEDKGKGIEEKERSVYSLSSYNLFYGAFKVDPVISYLFPFPVVSMGFFLSSILTQGISSFTYRPTVNHYLIVNSKDSKGIP